MTNHLRIALKHLFNEKNIEYEIELENYRVKRCRLNDTDLIAIAHLKFNGEDEFQTCQWEPGEKAMYICKGGNCPSAEIIFVLRTIQKLGYMIEHIFYGAIEDNSLEEDPALEKYLHNLSA